MDEFTVRLMPSKTLQDTVEQYERIEEPSEEEKTILQRLHAEQHRRILVGLITND